MIAGGIRSIRSLALPAPPARYPINTLVAALQGGEAPAIDLAGVDLDLAAHLAVELGERLSRPFVLIAPESADVRRLAGDLRFFAPSAEVVALPSIEASPYGDLSPDRHAVRRLMASLSRLAWGAPRFVVASAAGLARRLMPKDVLVEHTWLIGTGQPLDRDGCLRALADGGYHAVTQVEDPGSFAIRGGILDVFPPHRSQPVRIELWGDRVDSMRPFVPETQRTLPGAELDELLLPPVREELLVDPYKQRARDRILAAASAMGCPTRSLRALLDDLSSGIPFMGVEGFRPAFYQTSSDLFDYLPADPVFLVLDPLATSEQTLALWETRRGEHERLTGGERPRPALPPAEHLLSPAEVQAALASRATLRAHVLRLEAQGAQDGVGLGDAVHFAVPGNRDLATALQQSRSDREPLRPLAEAVRAWTAAGARVVIACRQATGLDRLQRILKSFGVPVDRPSERPSERPERPLRPPRGPAEHQAVLLSGEVSGGFRLLDHGVALITEEEIFGRKAPRRRARRADPTSPFVQSFRELDPGDYVVHADHGIGLYQGLEKLTMRAGGGALESDFLVIQFAGKDKLYLPVHKLGRVQKYVAGADTRPRVDKLGGTAWQRVRHKAREAAEADAFQLLELYAQRSLARGYAFSPPDDAFRAFEGTFPFEETEDQARAIDEVLADMSRERPMDRLLCGDVGFGKTEVAIRAAMKAVVDGKQVAVLVPTTVLAQQHYNTLSARFADYPVNVGLLSRFVAGPQQKVTLKALARGGVDILVGTHRLLSRDVVWQDLGLLILDEEHRFGVRHKERLKELRADVDALTMTATPIPRTLQMSLGGIRDLSSITTPPADRLSVRTYVCRATDQVIRDAILRELGRGGQVFFVHNRVHSIEARRAYLQALVPEARIAVGHGQMEPRKLEQVMMDFVQGQGNVLLCTTIIESGLDIPQANTILIDHADHLGLAQLYQLRGRVGRSRERGYCYLLVPGAAAIGGEARKRLSVIQRFTELGSGFAVATHDLEIRGAGELLGTKQTGQIAAVGLDLYAQLLQEAIGNLRGEAPATEFDPDVNLAVNARIPEEWLPDTHLRLVFYKRLANANDEEEVLAVAQEMGDRFGALPGPAANLIEVTRIRTLARRIGLRAVDTRADQISLTFHPDSPFPVPVIIDLVSATGTPFHAPANHRLAYRFDLAERRDTLGSTRICLQRLADLATESAGGQEIMT